MQTKKRKTVALLLIMLMLLSQASYIFANTVNRKVEGENLGNAYNKKYTLWGVDYSDNIERLSVDGKVAFCIEAGWGIPGFNVHNDKNSVMIQSTETVTKTDSLQSKIAYLGWYGNPSKTKEN